MRFLLAFLFLTSTVLPGSVPAVAQDTRETTQVAPQRGIAGIGGFEATSTVQFEGLETLPHELAATYVFPDRARWRIHNRAGRAADRSLYFRLGPDAFSLAPGARASTAFEGADLDHTLLQLELRRLVFLWPDGAIWTEQGTGTMRTAVGRRSDTDGPPIGTLEARVEDGRLLSMRAVDGDGDEVEELEVLEHFESSGRSWPKRLVLRQGGEVVWRETVDRLTTAIHYVDRYFLPADRRPITQVGGGRVVRSLNLQPVTVRAFALEPDTGWEQALARAAEWRDVCAEQLGDPNAIDPVPSFELDETARPTRCLVRLREARATPPEGWETHWDRPGLGMLLDRSEELTVAALRLLRSALPEGAHAGTPYCRITSPTGPSGVQLYVPLRLRDGEEPVAR